MRVFITGGSGFIGGALVEALLSRGDGACVLTRDSRRARRRLPEGVELVEGDPLAEGAWQERLRGCDAIVNLAGEPMNAKRWDARFRQLLHDSRVDTTRFVVESIGKLEQGERPRVLVSASGVDYYPFSLDLGRGSVWDEDDEVDERAPPGEGFLCRVCRNWEEEARDAEKLGARVVLLRTGIVLGDGGALPEMARPFRFFAGGRLGHGRQWTSWIHVADHVRAILFALDRDALAGPVNAVAPNPVRNRDLARALGRALRRPAWLRVPAFALRLAVGELAEYVLNGRRAIPGKLQAAGFEFRYPDIEGALGDLLRS